MLTVFQFLPVLVKVGLMFGTELCVATYFITMPFKQLRDNLIEIVNELVFMGLITALFYYNEKDKWTERSKWAFIGTMIGNNLVNTFISIVFLWIAMRTKLRLIVKERLINLRANKGENNTIQQLEQVQESKLDLVEEYEDPNLSPEERVKQKVNGVTAVEMRSREPVKKKIREETKQSKFERSPRSSVFDDDSLADVALRREIFKKRKFESEYAKHRNKVITNMYAKSKDYTKFKFNREPEEK